MRWLEGASEAELQKHIGDMQRSLAAKKLKPSQLQQTVRPPVVANASARAPWRRSYAEVTQQQVWVCELCGMKHAAWHASCHKCEQQQQKQAPAVVEMAVDESALSASLDTSIVRSAIICPEVVAFLAKLDKRPAPNTDSSELAAKEMADLLEQLAVSTVEEETVEFMAPAIRAAAAAAVKKATDDLVACESKAGHSSPPQPRSPEQADSMRAVAVLDAAAWKARAATHQTALRTELEGKLVAIKDAQEALGRQALLLESSYAESRAAWDATNAALEASWNERVEHLKSLCAAPPPSPPANGIQQELAALQLQMLSFKSEAEARHAAAVKIWQERVAQLEARIAEQGATSLTARAVSGGGPLLDPTPGGTLSEVSTELEERAVLESKAKGRSRSRSHERREASRLEREKKDSGALASAEDNGN